MYNLFSTYDLDRSGTIDAPNFVNARQAVNNEVDRIVSYYRNSNFVVSPSHLICQILKHLNVSLQRDLASYTMICYDEVERLSKMFKLIHPDVPNPDIRHGLFYNSSTPEYIVADESLFDYSKAYERWKTISPIKVHYHCFTDLNAPLLNGSYKNPVQEKGYAVISINIPLLAIQYRAWLEKGSKEAGFINRVENFVLRYPLLNTVYRHMEIAMMNRTIHTYLGLPVGKYFRLHPINVVDVTRIVDNSLQSRKHILENGRLRLRELFNSFDGLRKTCWLQFIKPPLVAKTRNTKWVIELQYIRLTLFWLKYAKANNIYFNDNQLKRDLKNLETDAIFYKGSNYPYNAIFEEFKKELGGY